MAPVGYQLLDESACEAKKTLSDDEPIAIVKSSCEKRNRRQLECNATATRTLALHG